MNKAKRLISVILALSIIMTSFVAFSREYVPLYKYMDDIFRFDVGDFAADSEVEETADKNARSKLLYTLGIWDDPEKSEDALLTLTELAVIMSNLKLGGENALKGVYNQTENANSDKATFKDAFEHLLGALGYYYRCAEYGNTDESLLIVSADIGLISGGIPNISSFITRGELAELITRALTINLCTMEYTSSGGYKYTIADGKNLLNSVHGIYIMDGFVNAVPGLAVYGGASVRDGYIQIDRRNVRTSGLKLDKFLGSRVVAYTSYDEETSEYSILYIDYAEDYQVLEIDFTDIISISGSTLSYYAEDGTEQELEADNLKYITQNGTKLDSFSDMCKYSENEGKIVFTASEKKGEIDTAMIYRYNYFVVGYVDVRQNRIGIQFEQTYNGNNYLQLKERAVVSVEIDGEASEYTLIPSGSAIRYFTCADTGYTEIIAKTKKVEGEISGIYDDIVTIMGKDYRQSRDFLNIIKLGETGAFSEYERVKPLELGMSTSYYVFDDILVGYTATQTYRWGFLRSISAERTSIEPDLTLLILTENSDWIELKLTDKLELDGEPGVTKEEFLRRVNNNPEIYNNIIRYKIGKVGEIAGLDTIEKSRYEAESVDDVEFVYNFNYAMNWTGDWLKMDCPYFVSPKTIVFVVPAGEDDPNKFKAINTAALPTGSTESDYIPMKFYTPNEMQQIGAAVCTKALEDIGTGSSGDTVFVEKVRYALLDADKQEYGYRVIGKKLVADLAQPSFGRLTDITFSVSEEMMDKNLVDKDDPSYDVNKLMEVGDLVSVTVSGGKVGGWNMLLKEGRVPPLASETEDPDDKDKVTESTTGYKGPGIVRKVDAASQYMLVEYDGETFPILSRCKVSINPETHQLTHLTAADFNEGEKVYTVVNYGRASAVVKNVDY